jgi:hypothetical protein
MQKLKIISVTDFDGNKKDNHVWGTVRATPCYPFKIGQRMYLYYADDETKVRITTEIKAIQDGLDGTKQYFTRNSIYTLQELGDD